MTYTCPKCERSLRNPKQWHNCVKVEIDSLFEGKSKELIFVFDKLLAEVIDWKDVAVSATKNCIVFVHHQTFLIVKPMKSVVDLKFYSALEKTGQPILKSVPYSGKFENHIRLSKIEEVSPLVIKHLMDSYKFL
jgi:Domain of unknown function (DUF5655)